MSLLLIFVISIAGILLGKYIFKAWFNHLSLYCIIMGGLIFLYELKFLPYPDIIPLAWFFIISAFLSLLLGILTIVSARNLYDKDNALSQKSEVSLTIFADGGKALKYSILFFSLIGLFVALHRWVVLIDMFGSVGAVFLKAGVVYRLNVEGEIKEFIPILPSFVYIAVFLSGIYTAYKGRFSFLSFFPILCIILKELTYFGRGEMLFSSMEFLFTFLLFRILLRNDTFKRFKFSYKNAYVALTIFLLFLVTAASLVRTSRGVKENFHGASKELRQLEDSMILSPSVYLYLSSDVGVFSKYLELEKEEAKFGQNSFRIVYDLFSRLKIFEKTAFFQRGYFIPMWTNTGTYIREIHSDFGAAGVFLGPYLFGLLITWLWFRFYEKRNLLVLVFLVYLYIIIGFSFLTMVTRLNQWIFSQVLLIAYIPILEKIASRKSVAKT
ncbi:MAG: oligosaccharide repeat unit polymerase [Bacteroidetes bacterium]|nr:oligosaccharide repeat unit polymerase [Bacteroidota bacterium]